MTFRCSISGAVGLLLGAVLWAGCSTPGSGPASAGGSRAKLTRKQEAQSEAELDQRVRTMAHFATGLSYDLNEKPDLAREEFLSAGQTDPGAEPVVIEAASRCLRDKKSDQAIDLLTRATALPGASGTLYTLLGLAYAQAGKTDLAIAATHTAIKKAPQALAPYQNLAQIYLQSGRTNEALHALDEAARQPTDNPGYLIDLADLYVRYSRAQGTQGQSVKTRLEELLDRAADLSPSNPLQVLRLADYYFTLGNLKKSEPLYRQLLDEHPDVPGLRDKLAEIYFRSGQKDKASAQLEALAQNEPTNPKAYIILGSLEAEEKKYREAAEHFERALKLDPTLEQVYYDLAGLKLSLKKPDEALTILNQARERFKMSFPLEFYTGVTYGALKKYKDALNFLTSAEAVAKATEPDRLNGVFYFQLGSTYERMGDVAEAEKYFRQCLKLSPDDAEALNYLGYMWADRGVNLDEARTLIDKAVHLEPDNAAFLDSLAWVLYKLHQPKEALSPMLKAIEHTDEPDPTLFDHLGDIYSALKEYVPAREAWNKALKLEPNEQIQQKLNAAPAASQASP